ncbi:hypothetical protein ODZ84_03700 [Chryseobacterium fluminis]|uniref:hypothetical protein n=1 Tax=Chryseobacterium fluminis TaxID=2983606 RepID=UPI0022555564|nr:hypothetical protein [Chryseobacterium sp. MMS21-Ot14]UZT98691.1 hypothetical protein ODZ84_03700 [Chryseobacterium sp. MMS21-Ot14]
MNIQKLFLRQIMKFLQIRRKKLMRLNSINIQNKTKRILTLRVKLKLINHLKCRSLRKEAQKSILKYRVKQSSLSNQTKIQNRRKPKEKVKKAQKINSKTLKIITSWKKVIIPGLKKLMKKTEKGQRLQFGAYSIIIIWGSIIIILIAFFLWFRKTELFRKIFKIKIDETTNN